MKDVYKRQVVDEAILAGADMLVTHHPLIFSGMKQVNNQNFIGRRLVKLIQHDISYYAMHTNYDVKGLSLIHIWQRIRHFLV